MRLYDERGRRLYLNASERARFLAVAGNHALPVTALCHCLAFTGCRISEALALRGDDLQTEEGIIAIHSLKKREPGHIREIPIPDSLAVMMGEIALYEHRLWPIGRATAWRHIKRVMREANITGPQASPKGLRHAFAVHATISNVSPLILQKWMGHADIRTTAIYTMVSGPEERMLAERMWG